jgi:hypothetical protein
VRARAIAPVKAVVRFAVVGGLATAWASGAVATLAASPAPTAAGVGDPRSSGQGPGLAGDPLFAIGVVVAIAILSLVVTLAYVRASGGPGGRTPG